jgi:hypothetical protein
MPPSGLGRHVATGYRVSRILYRALMADEQEQRGTDRDRALADLQALIETTKWCQDQIREVRRGYSSALADLEGGSLVADALANVPASKVRPQMTEAIAALEAARKKSRVSLIRADLAEGSSVTEVARTWGASHQLISRYMQRAEDIGD